MIPLAVPLLAGREAEYLQACIDSTFVSSVGPFVTRLEEMAAAAAEAGGAVVTSAGTTGLHAALVALGVGRDDLVILPAYTFIASANAIAQAGATPWILDIDADSWTLDPALLQATLKAETTRDGERLIHKPTGRRVAAVMPVYTLGLPADMDPIVATAKAYGLPVLADAAAAIGATYKGRAVGRMGADLSVFSFNGNKTVTAGGGGAVLGNDPALLQTVRHITTTARVGADYHHDRVGFNYRMTNLQAAVGCAQMERATELVAAKRRIHAVYDAAFAGIDGVRTFPQPAWAESACWFSGLMLDQRFGPLATIRDAMREAGIDARPFWQPMHLQTPYVSAPRTQLPVSEAIWQRILTLPCSAGLTEDEQQTVIETLTSLLNR